MSVTNFFLAGMAREPDDERLRLLRHQGVQCLLDLVESIMQPRGEFPVLMVALARPELLDRRPGWGGGRRNYVSLALEPLTDGDVAKLVDHLLGRVSGAIIERVVARAEGNPFFAGEIVRSIAA